MNGRDILAHKLVLARHSKLFDAFFTEGPGCSHDAYYPIPFDIDNLFPEIVDFCYTHHWALRSTGDDFPHRNSNLSRITSLYAMSLVYGLEELEFCLSDVLKRVLRKENVLELVRPYTKFKLNPKLTSLFNGLQESFDSMMATCSIFSEIIAENFNSFSLTDIYSSLTPALFASTLQKLPSDVADDERKVALIDGFVAFTGMPNDHDRDILSQVIDWSREDSYLLFSRHECEWVSSEISRAAISRVLDNRRDTFHLFEQEMETLDSDRYISWAIFNCLNGIRNSESISDFGDYEITDFLGTIGGCTDSFNPMLYRLLKPYCSRALQVDQCRDLMYDHETLAEPYEYYFLSDPACQTTPFVGYEFPSNCFVVKRVVVVTQAGKPQPQGLALRMYSGRAEAPTCVFERKQEYGGGVPEWTFCVECDRPVRRIVVEQTKENTSGCNILRVLSLRVYGHFSTVAG